MSRALRRGGGHFSRVPVAGNLQRPTRGFQRRGPRLSAYLGLLRAGLAVPSRSPGRRWALTPPFHPCRPEAGGLFSVALSLGFGLRLLPRWALPTALSYGGRTFLARAPRGSPNFRLPAVRPAALARRPVRQSFYTIAARTQAQAAATGGAHKRHWAGLQKGRRTVMIWGATSGSYAPLPNFFRTASNAFTSASKSLSVVYRWTLARAVAGRPSQ